MSSLTTYWLCRAPGSATEGPFTLDQLHKMHEAGSVTADSVVCRQGEAGWMILGVELKASEVKGGSVLMPRPIPSQERSFEDAMRTRDHEQAENYNRAIFWITAALCLLGAVPLLGLLAFVVYGFWAFVGLILCILQMSRGQVGRGIGNLIGVMIIGPLFILLMQFIWAWLGSHGAV